jgi:hypothetical protein
MLLRAPSLNSNLFNSQKVEHVLIWYWNYSPKYEIKFRTVTEGKKKIESCFFRSPSSLKELLYCHISEKKLSHVFAFLSL